MAKFKIWVYDRVEREFDSAEDATSWINFMSPPTEQETSCEGYIPGEWTKEQLKVFMQGVITGKGEYAPKAKSKSLPTADLPETIVVQMPRARKDGDGEFLYSYDEVQISLERLAEKLAPILFDYDKLGEKLGKWLNDRDQQKLSNRTLEYVNDKLHPMEWSKQEQIKLFNQVKAERDQYKAERDMFESLYEAAYTKFHR